MNLNFLQESLITALRVAIIIIPLLFLFDLLNHHYGEKIERAIKRSRRFMPLLGALFGLLPGCNVGVVVAVLYAQGGTTLGTLLATLIATSDESLYVFIPLGFNFFPLLLAKFILALVVGYSVDIFYHKKLTKSEEVKHQHIDFCCAEHPHSGSSKKMFFHALKHGFRIILIVFVVLAFLNYFQDRVSIENLTGGLGKLGLLQPPIIALIGLIPGCGTSVGIATLYAKGIITFGSAVAGLSTASGEALIVLWGQLKNKAIILKIALILFITSTLFGILLELVKKY